MTTTPAGTTYRLAPSAESVPSADVLAVIDAATAALVAANGGGPLWDGGLFVSDRNHGDVDSEGAWCLAFEGAYEWPSYFTSAQHDDRTVPRTVHIEPGTGWWLGVYPA